MSLIQRDGLRVVIGLGKTGLSCVRFLKSRGYPVAVIDTRATPPGLAEFKAEFPDVNVYVGGLHQAVLLTASEIVSSPGVAIKEPEIQAAMNAGIPVVGDIDLFCRQVTAPIVAITGSNAKSTVTTLVGLMAEKAGINTGVGGNLGTPVLDMIRDVGEQDLYVLELSSFQLETTHSLKAAVAVVLNISEDHMDRYDSMMAYHQAKHRVFRNCLSYVINRDDPLTRPLLPEATPCRSFGLNVPDLNEFGVITFDGEKYLAQGVNKLMKVSGMKIVGEHNVANALASLALGCAVNIPMPAMLDALREFPGLDHRCQLVTKKKDIGWYNDSKGTNVGATLAAIDGLGAAIKGKLILLAGGVGKGQDFQPLSDAMAKSGKTLIFFGEDGQKIADAVTANHIQKVRVDTLVDAVAKADELALSGDAVLLSPACASFDMFNGYDDRGNQFVAAVKAQVGA